MKRLHYPCKTCEKWAPADPEQPGPRPPCPFRADCKELADWREYRRKAREWLRSFNLTDIGPTSGGRR